MLVKYNRRANPNRRSFTHNSPVEIAWTIGPIVILVFIGAFSLPILFKQQEIPEGDINIKVTGYQWYWGYEYTDHDFEFSSFMIGSPATGGDNRLTPEVEEQLHRGRLQPRRVPAGHRHLGGGAGGQDRGDDRHRGRRDPQLDDPGLRREAGRGAGPSGAAVVHAEKEGIYFGQCSELCGQAHAYMPITVKVVSQEEYDRVARRCDRRICRERRATIDVASAE